MGNFIRLTTISVFLSVLFLTGCGGQTGDESGYEPVASYEENQTVVPYTIPRFRSVLDKCKLQYSEGTVIFYKKLKTFKASYFYAKDDALFFVVDKLKSMDKLRCELRPQDEWQTSDTTVHHWHGRLRCYMPEQGVNSYNWMQIHGTMQTFNYPLVRLLWVRKRQGISDHLWAIVIVSDAYVEPKKYEWVDLGARPGDYFDADVNVSSDIMNISVNGKLVKSFDVSNWRGVDNYFKAGVYINRPEDYGKATVSFKALQF